MRLVLKKKSVFPELYLLVHKEKILGRVKISWSHRYFDPDYDNRIWTAQLDSFKILKPFRGKRLSKILLEKAIHKCKHIKGVTRIALVVRPENEIAINLYRSFGFVTDGRIFVSTGYAASELIEMTLDLK